MATFPTGGTVTGLSLDPFANLLYVAVKTGATTGSVLVIHTTQDKVVATLDPGGAPGNVVANRSATTAYVTVGGCSDPSGKIAIIDGKTKTVTATPATATGFDRGIAVVSSTATFYANPCGKNLMQEYDGTTGNATTKTIPTTGQVVAMDSDANSLYWFGNASGSATLTKVPLFGTPTPTTTTYGGTAVSVTAIFGAGQAAIVTNNPDTVQYADPLTLKLDPGFKPQWARYGVEAEDGGSQPLIKVCGCYSDGSSTCLIYDLSGNEVSFDDRDPINCLAAFFFDWEDKHDYVVIPGSPDKVVDIVYTH